MWILPSASGSVVGSSEDGAKRSGSMVDRPFLSMILSAADPEPASSLSELSAKVKMVLPIHRLIIGLFAWDVSLQLSSRMSGSPPSDASMISVVRSRLMLSGLIGHSLAPFGVNSAELLVLLIKDPMVLLLRSNDFRSC